MMQSVGQDGGMKCCLPSREMCRLLNKEWKQRTGSDISRKNQKNVEKILTMCTLVHPRHLKKPSARRSPFHPQTRLFLCYQRAADVFSDQADGRRNTHSHCSNTLESAQASEPVRLPLLYFPALSAHWLRSYSIKSLLVINWARRDGGAGFSVAH